MKELLEMKLHDLLHTDNYEILRVHGGWVYTCFRESGGTYALSSTFVPYITKTSVQYEVL